MCRDFETSNIFASGTALACTLFRTTNRISVLADSNVRSNRHPPAMLRLQPRQRGNLAAFTQAKFDGRVTSLTARHCRKLRKQWNQLQELAFTNP
jgi:hypothetical protein